VGQILTDEFFGDVEHSLRELGIGDMGVPKRMKKLARMFYGRTTAYSDALERGDRPALAAALARNIRPDTAEWPQADALAGYVVAADRQLAGQATAGILGGVLRYPEPGTSTGGSI
jgi:cytochrome b pre-mRNA-processing protein 3